MKLLCRTENDSNPNGKQKVYFAAHPEDYELLDEISGDILKLQDCAIYYDAEPRAGYEEKELYECLNQMQLLVLPITGQFLREENRAFEVEFPYAIQTHIPVLPLMQRKGLEDSLQGEADYFKNLANEFNERLEERFPDDPGEKRDRYRNLQMLNPYDSDPTAIPFEDKLKKFLSSVLVNDELAEKIRAAFDAYIFLSYRKKDRAYANKLIRLIHENEFCRNIAIWFDEFLLPGENFSTAIEAAMEKSSLFALAVTPNVLEEKNFVKDEEYPRARETAGKVIFPVVLAPLEEDEERKLLEMFPGIPERVDAVGDMGENGKGTRFADALFQAVRRAGIQLRESSPVHNFLIGMAYMNGIDVEKDARRALELIRGAAEDGLPEAVSKLVDLYGTGNGVALDYREAARWQEKEVAQLRKEFAGEESPETVHKLADALAALGDYRYGVRDLEGAGAAYGELEGILEKFRELSPENGAPLRYLASYYMNTASILYSAGRLEQAGQYLRKCWETAETLDDGNLELGILQLLGHVRRKQGKLDAAEELYRKVYDIVEKKYQAQSRDRVWRRYLIPCCNQMGRICQEQGRWEDAERYYSRMLELCLRLAEEEKTPKSLEDLALAYAKLGDASRVLKRLEDSKRYVQRAWELYQDLYERYGTMEVKRGLSLTYERLGDICMAENRPGDALKFYEKYFVLSNMLYEEGS